MAGNVQEFTAANFDQAVLKSDKPVLVDFWAVWCGPCKMIAPHVEAIATEMAGQAVVAKLDVATHTSIAARYGVGSIPTLLFFKGGQVVDQVVGAVPKSQLEALIKKAL